MKIKLLGLAIASLLIYSCASKKNTQAATPSKPEEKKEVVVSLNDKQLHGKALYEQNCAKCHKLFSPSKHDTQGWKGTLAVMQKKARISDEDTASIYEYLTTSL